VYIYIYIYTERVRERERERERERGMPIYKQNTSGIRWVDQGVASACFMAAEPLDPASASFSAADAALGALAS